MIKNEFSSIDIIKVVGCLIFDIAIILGFFITFTLLLIASPIRAVVAFFILLISLVVLNGAVIFSGRIYKTIGVPYTVSIVFVSVLYFALANIPLIFFISALTVWYLIYELIILSFFIIIMSVILLFSKLQINDSKEFRVNDNSKKLIVKNDDN